MLYREIMAVCFEIHTKHTNTLCGQNVELLNVKPVGTYSDHPYFNTYDTAHVTHAKHICSKINTFILDSALTPR